MSRRGKVERVILGAFGVFVMAFGLLGIFTWWFPWIGLVSVLASLLLLLEATEWAIRRAERD